MRNPLAATVRTGHDGAMGEAGSAGIAIGATALGVLMVVGLVWLSRALTRRTMQAARQAAVAAGLRLDESSWRSGMSDIRGNAAFGGWPVQLALSGGKHASSKIYLLLPCPLHWSASLQAGPPGLGGVWTPKVTGGLAVARGWLDPPEAERLLTPEIARRLESHDVWRATRVTLTATLVEYWGAGVLTDAAVLREVLEVMVLVAERGLAIERGA